MKKHHPLFEQYVHSLSRQELQDMALRFAPESFKEAVVTKLAGTDEKGELFLRIKRDVDRAFEGDLHNDFGQFESDIDATMERLRGLWDVLPREVCALFVSVIERVDESFDDGALYDHYSDGFYEGEHVGRLMADFILDLPGEEKRSSFVAICNALAQQGYGTFASFIPVLVERMTHADKVALKETLLNQGMLESIAYPASHDVFEAFTPVLSDTEQTSLLEDLAPKDDYFALKLASHYETHGMPERACEILHSALADMSEGFDQFRNETGAVFQHVILLEQKLGHVQKAIALMHDYLERIPTADTLQFVVCHAHGAQSDFECLLETASPQEYVAYLERINRLPAIPAIFDRYTSNFTPEARFTVYERYPEVFPHELHDTAHVVLKDALRSAGDYHYAYVAQILRSLRKVTPKDTFDTLLNDIRTTYKRRRNLLKILSERGL